MVFFVVCSMFFVNPSGVYTKKERFEDSKYTLSVYELSYVVTAKNSYKLYFPMDNCTLTRINEKLRRRK